MFQYLLRRILLFLPTLLVISWIAFGLSKASNSDPVASRCAQEEAENFQDVVQQEAHCRGIAADFGLDKPVFYAAIRPKAFPDSLYRVFDPNKRAARHNLVAQYGNWNEIEAYFNAQRHLKRAVYDLPDSLDKDIKILLKADLDQLEVQYQTERVDYFLKTIQNNLSKDSVFQTALNPAFQQTQSTYQNIKKQATPHLLYIPTMHWYGFDNQYHNWISGFFKGDFGTSYYDGRPVSTRIWEALGWTLLLNSISILLAYLISIPLGVWTAVARDTWKDRFVSTILFMLYALPSFWVATLLVVFFTTSEYGMDFFPTTGVGKLEATAPFGSRFWDTAYHLILPVFCLTYASFAFIARQMRGGMLNVLEQEYMKTAKAKGLSDSKRVWKHGFRNALFPIITLFASVFPSALAGSVIIEVIFNIPGMGRLAYEALFQGDWPIIYTVLMLAAILTMLGNLLADILFSIADPRVRFE